MVHYFLLDILDMLDILDLWNPIPALSIISGYLWVVPQAGSWKGFPVPVLIAFSVPKPFSNVRIAFGVYSTFLHGLHCLIQVATVASRPFFV